MARKTLIRNARIINEGRQFSGGLLIEGDLIREIYDKDPIPEPVDAEVIDARGQWLLPGVIDDQVHFREPGLTHKGDIQSESASGIAGGVTSFMEMPNTLPPTITLELLKEKQERAAMTSLANYSFYIGATNDNLKVLQEADPETVCGIKVFMGSSTGNMLVDHPEALRGIFEQKKFLVAVHCEDETTIRKNLEIYRNKYQDRIPVRCHPEIRSEEACFLSSSRAVELASRCGTRLHLLHLSTAKELSLLSNKRPLREKKITGEVCVHHLWFDDKDYDRLGNKIKWNPAIKTAKDREALLAAVNDQTLDIVATDHAPHTTEEKQREYLTAPSGGPLLQHSLVMMLELHRMGKISIEQVVKVMCHQPAELFNIRQRGFIRKGYYADLVLADPEISWIVQPENILAKCGWSPLEGTQFHTSVTHTWVNGNLVYKNGKFLNSSRGQLIRFDR
jgi:dihydroorotase